MYKIRVTTTMQQLDHDGRVLFSASDTADVSSISPTKDNEVDVPDAFMRASNKIDCRMLDVLRAHYVPAKRERGLYEDLTIRDRSRSKAQSRLIGGIPG